MLHGRQIPVHQINECLKTVSGTLVTDCKAMYDSVVRACSSGYGCNDQSDDSRRTHEVGGARSAGHLGLLRQAAVGPGTRPELHFIQASQDHETKTPWTKSTMKIDPPWCPATVMKTLRVTSRMSSSRPARAWPLLYRLVPPRSQLCRTLPGLVRSSFQVWRYFTSSKGSTEPPVS
eukprot:9084823-Pyramimonas_sp.AAC.1